MQSRLLQVGVSAAAFTATAIAVQVILGALTTAHPGGYAAAGVLGCCAGVALGVFATRGPLAAPLEPGASHLCRPGAAPLAHDIDELIAVHTCARSVGVAEILVVHRR